MNGQPTPTGLLADNTTQQRRGLRDIFTPDVRDRLSIALEGMSLRPNQGIIDLAQQRIGQRREEQQMQQQRNATADWLESQELRQLAQGVRSGAITGAEAMTLAQGQPRGYQTLTGTQLIEQYGVQPGAIDPNALYNLSGQGQITKVGGGGTVVNVGGEAGSEFRTQSEKIIATQMGEISSEGFSAQRNLGLINQLEQELQEAPQGFGGALVGMAGNLGLELGEGAGAVQAATAIINRLVPQQRQPGSGPMSDADLELFKQSLPRIINQPEGNRRIVETLKAIAQYDIDRGNIARQAQIGAISPFEALQQIQSLPNPLGWVRSMSTQAVTDSERNEATRILLGE